MLSGRKQRLSRDIARSYIFVLVVFFIVAVAVSLTNWKHLKDNAKRDVELAKDFLAGEFMEEEVQSTREIFEDAEEELPDISGLDFRIRRGGEEYSTGKIPDLKLKYTSGIRDYSNYEYYIYNYHLPVYKGEDAQVTIVRELKREKRFIKQQVVIFLIAFPIIILCLYMIYRHFYRKIIPQLREIEGITDSINLDSLDLKLIREGYYEEFDNMLTSYERMLKRLEDQKSAHIAFVHNASHELKTPIFVIKGYSDILKKWGTENKEVSQEAVEAIGTEVRSMQSLTEKLLFLAKGKNIQPVYEEVRLDEVVEEVKRELSFIYSQVGVEVRGEVLKIHTDRELLRILVKNLMENALKYGGGKDVRVEIGLRGNSPLIEIEDQGEGMTSEEVKEIFTEFYRGDESRNREIEGHGLGLSIVKNIQEILEAELKVDSIKGRGTRVEILLKDN
jgi:signal transduction histidine kinase